jgi:hypothetical protein
VRRRQRCIAGAALCFFAASASAADAATVEQRAVATSVNYVFASELGSGVYTVSGRTLQVYRIPVSWQFREPNRDTFGVRLISPITLGFYDFKPEDLFHTGLPSHVDTFSVVPGVELEYVFQNGWHLIPYAGVGVSVASSSVDATLYSAGLRLERTTELGAWERFVSIELEYAAAAFHDDLSNEEFARLRTGLEMRKGLGRQLYGAELEWGAYGMAEAILNPPVPPLPDAEKQTLQFEAGLMLETDPPWRFWGMSLPRLGLGLGYRFAGDFSGWRLVFGAPF